MSKSTRLRTSDVRELHRLTGECRELGDDAIAWRLHLFRRLAKLVDCELGIGGELMVGASAPRVLGTADWGWENGLDRTAFVRAMEEAAGVLASAMPLLIYLQRFGSAGGPCVSRPELLTDDAWYLSCYYQTIQGAYGGDHMLMSYRATPGVPGHLDGINLTRAKGRAPFSERERRLVDEAHSLVTQLSGGPLARFTAPSPSGLPPRAREVLCCLLEGDSDKQIARRLRISPYTVNQYTKFIYRHFRVAGRAELLALWIRRAYPIGFSWAPDPLA